MAGAEDELTIDGPMRAALARLTDNEQACLRHRLQHRTAKEIALELGDAPRRQYIANVDNDGDGKVSFEEFAEPVMPQFLRRGIPLIPADWKPNP